MRKIYYLLSILLVPYLSFAQQNDVAKKEDSLLAIVAKTNEGKDQYPHYIKLSKLYRGIDRVKEEAYLDKALFIAEQTRDRVFISSAFIEIVTIYQIFGNLGERKDKIARLIDKGLNIAKESQLNDKVAIMYTKKAVAARLQGDINAALKNNEESVNYAGLTDNDSVKVIAEISYANSLMSKDENLTAFKRYMKALEIAEISDDNNLKISIYTRLAQFYNSVGQQEKAKDYAAKAIEYAKKEKQLDSEFSMYSFLIQLYINAKDIATAREYLKIYKEKSKLSPDSFHKQSALLNELNLIFEEDKTKVPSYIRNNKKLFDDITLMGYQMETFRSYALMYSLENKVDSAMHYFNLAKQAIKPNDPPTFTLNWNMTYIDHLKRMNKPTEMIKYLEENIAISKQIQSLTLQKEFRKDLDSAYITAGNKQLEIENKLLLYQLTDSLEKQQKAKDVLNIEIDAENKRAEREAETKKVKLRKKHDLQYMGITAGILGVFIALAALGRLKVKPWLIRGLGFLSFILLFEFLILLVDKQIHDLTHGDVLQIFLIKIVLIAILMPFHHWLEHKVVHYLMRHREAAKVKIDAT
jgi:hypothetical protein